MLDEIDEKKHCPYCQSDKVKLAGLTKLNKQRYQCLICKKTYIWKLNKNVNQGRYSWFVLWMKEGFTIKQIAKQKRVSRATVQLCINYWLKRNPPQQKINKEVKHVIFDGTYLDNKTGIYVAMDAITHKVVYGECGFREVNKDLIIFYSYLTLKGLNPISATIDGSVQQFKYLREHWPNMLIQRCIVHVCRQGLSWLRLQPKTEESKQLKKILLFLRYVKTYQEAEIFKLRYSEWIETFREKIKESKHDGASYHDIYKASSMITNALPYLFHYLENDYITKSTNALEGYFGRLKEKYRRHRGLSKRKRKNYFAWYFYLIPL